MPVPSAFMTASLAAKRAAKLWADVGGPGGVGPLGLGEAAAGRARPAVEYLPEPRHVDRVEPTPTIEMPEADHSTVTVLARLRGRSGSWPCSRARR